MTAVCCAEDAVPAPLSSPSIAGPLRPAPPVPIDAGPLGKLALNGVVSGLGLWQGHHAAGDDSTQADLSNGQLILQKAEGWWQFYLQAGGYNIPSLGLPFLASVDTTRNLYGPVPVAWLKLAPAKDTSILIGALPTLMGAESTFTFQNMNIERGLLWNQENAVNRGVQVNQTLGKLTASLAWTDGYYSNRYSWLSGSLTYTVGAHAVTFSGMGNLSQTVFQTPATPAQNNSTMYALIYTFSKDKWTLQPYLQFSDVQGASSRGGALLAKCSFPRGFSLAGRWEYIDTTGSAARQSVNLLYGPGSAAMSATVTPTCQRGRLFLRADLSYVRALAYTPGQAFGPSGTYRGQPRAVLEVGFLF